MPSNPNACVGHAPAPGQEKLLVSSFVPAWTACTIQANGSKCPEYALMMPVRRVECWIDSLMA